MKNLVETWKLANNQSNQSNCWVQNSNVKSTKITKLLNYKLPKTIILIANLILVTLYNIKHWHSKSKTKKNQGEECRQLTAILNKYADCRQQKSRNTQKNEIRPQKNSSTTNATRRYYDLNCINSGTFCARGVQEKAPIRRFFHRVPSARLFHKPL